MPNEKKIIYTLVAQNEKYLKKLDQSERKLRAVEKAAGQSISQITKNFNSLGGRPVSAMNRFGKAANDNVKSANRNLGQLGFQIQDIAVQLQGGQNPLLVLSQQGSQVASIFGPGGIVVGAFLAVAAAIGSALLPSLFKTNDAIKDLDKSMDALNEIMTETKDKTLVLTDEFAKLAQTSETLSAAQFRRVMLDIDEAIENANKQARSLINSLSPNELGGRFDRTARFVDKARRQFENGSITLKEFNDRIQELFVQTAKPSKALREISGELDELNAKVQEAERRRERLLGGGLPTESGAEQLKKLKERLKEEARLEAAAIEEEKTRRLEKFFKIEDSLRTETQMVKDNFNERIAFVKGFHKTNKIMQKEADEVEKALIKKRNAEVAALRAHELAGLGGFMAQQATILESGFGKNNAISKAAFAAQKALAIPQMIVSTEQGAAKALAFGPPVGPILSAAIKALGYASVGVVAGQSIASFEGGGLTGPGVRAGGIDGHGGQLAVLHPNEKVMDLQKESANDGWQIVVNNNAGAAITQDIDEDQKVISIMVDQASKSTSPFMEAMKQNSNVESRGRRR